MDTDALIVGGGLVGTATALALAQGGVRSILIDPAPADARAAAGFDGRSYAVNQASCAMLRALGLWEGEVAASQPILDIKVADGRPGEGPSPLHLHFDHAEIEGGPMGHMIEDRHLRRALLRAVAKEERVTHLEGRMVRAQRTALRAEVDLDDGRTLSGAVVIGADGRPGRTAERAGIRRTVKRYGQTSLVTALKVERPHDGVAHQLFLPAGPLAILPLTENRVSLVWTEREDEAARIQALRDDAYLAHLRPLFGDFLGEIALAGARWTYPLTLVLAERFVADRVALIGDAAHGLHPIAGQGLNAGLKDVAALAEVMSDARRRGQDVGTGPVLTAYQRWRRFDAASQAYATDAFNRLFSNDNALVRGVRDIGMGLVQNLPSLRRTIIREAAGLSGERPRLMRGEPL